MLYRLIVFDLDFTLWNAGGTWCDHTSPPFRRSGDQVLDSENAVISLYPDVLKILRDLDGNYDLGVASRTGAPAWAKELMDLFDITKHFGYREIYPGSKSVHFQQLRKETGIPFTQMLFFDDEFRNVEEVGRLGVKTVLVRNGVTRNLVETSLRDQENQTSK